MSVFNEQKTIEQYKKTPLFLGAEQGLFDTVHKQYPKIWDLYKEMKSLDWSEDEFNFKQCLIDFKTCPKEVSEMMIKTLAWQWEADSVASRAIAPVFAPFISSSELWACWQRISDNEVIHAATYSEIVRLSFEDPEEVLKDILAEQEALSRLSNVARVLNTLYHVSHEYALGICKLSREELMEVIYLGVVALYLLERVQFVASFAITFTICGSGLFQPIGKAVQKIAQDEFEVHCELDKEILKILHEDEGGEELRQRCKPIVEELFKEVVESEMRWTEYLFSDGRTLLGTNEELIKKWVLYNAAEVAHFFGLKEHGYKLPRKNPMPYMEKWLNMNKQQAAPQEQDIAAYKIGVVVSDVDDDEVFDL